MVDLRGFPVSDEFNFDRKTFCVILDPNAIFDISMSSTFPCLRRKKSHVTAEDMEMSEISLRIEWKHFRKPAVTVCEREKNV